MAAGTSLQRAMEGLLAHYWAHVDTGNNRGVIIMRKIQRAGAPNGMEWIAIKDKVLQDAVAQHPDIFCTELKRLGYQLIPRMHDPPGSSVLAISPRGPPVRSYLTCQVESYTSCPKDLFLDIIRS